MASTLHLTLTTCPICGKPAEEPPRTGDRRDFDCSGGCGRYAISGSVVAMLKHRPLDTWEKATLAAWIANQRRDGKNRPIITSYALQRGTGSGG
jgi:hypothetical protein